MSMNVEDMTVSCSCGKVKIEVTGAPIMHVACYCNDCQVGGRQIEALTGAAPVLEPDGGTPFLLYRKDRVNYTRADQLLRPYKIKDTSPTSRSSQLAAIQQCSSTSRTALAYDVPETVQGDVRRCDARLARSPNKRRESSGRVLIMQPSVGFFAKLCVAWIPMLLIDDPPSEGDTY